MCLAGSRGAGESTWLHPSTVSPHLFLSSQVSVFSVKSPSVQEVII